MSLYTENSTFCTNPKMFRKIRNAFDCRSRKRRFERKKEESYRSLRLMDTDSDFVGSSSSTNGCFGSESWEDIGCGNKHDSSAGHFFPFRLCRKQAKTNLYLLDSRTDSKLPFCPYKSSDLDSITLPSSAGDPR